MEPVTMQLVSELMPKLHAAFPRNLGKDNPAMMVEVYRNGLRGLSGDAVRAAVDRAIQEDQYFPKVARIRELAAAWQRYNAPSHEVRREASWNVCSICGAEAKPREITRLKRDPQERYALVLDKHGAPIWETVDSAMLYMDHDPARHHVERGHEG